MERSIPQGVGAEAGVGENRSGGTPLDRTGERPDVEPRDELADGQEDDPAEELEDDWAEQPSWLDPAMRSVIVGYGLMMLCLIVFVFIRLDRPNHYLHFVLQAQAWLDGATSIPMPGYQDVMPIIGPDGAYTGRGIIPFPPLPAWALLPFVSLWHERTDQQLISAVFGAVDVGLGYWMLGRLRMTGKLRGLVSLFFGLGTVLFYTSATGTTWFWAHIVAVACLLLSVGFALVADPDAAEPRPLAEAKGARHGWVVPGGWLTALLLIGAAVLTEIFLWAADSHKPPAALAAAGLGIGILAALLAVSVAGRWRVLAAPGIVLLAAVGVPGLFLIAALAPGVTAVVDVALILAVIFGAGFVARGGERTTRFLVSVYEAVTSPEGLQVAAGLLFGLAVMARLTILLGFPFFMLVGGGGTWMRRTLLAGAGAAVPLVALLLVTYATSGQLFNPAYDYLYQNELLETMDPATGLSIFNYHSNWAISDLRYVPQNLMLMLFQGPEINPAVVGIAGPDVAGVPACQAAGAARGFFDAHCPMMMPNATGMSLLLSSPGFMVAPFALATLYRLRLDRVTLGATIAVVAIAIANLMHFSQGWVEFGYRFSNDFVPFALLLVVLGAQRIGRLWPFALLVVISIVVNFWGVIWGAILGW